MAARELRETMSGILELFLFWYGTSVLFVGFLIVYLAPSNENLQKALAKISPLRGALLMTLIVLLWPLACLWASSEDSKDE
jgi:heme/copper-type cytochrome/quinol oxidase subunit 3